MIALYGIIPICIVSTLLSVSACIHGKHVDRAALVERAHDEGSL